MNISKKALFICLLSLLTFGASVYAQEYNGPSAASIQKPSCSNTAYSVTISWTDTESGTYLVNVSTDSDFFNVWEKVVESFSTQAPAGCENFDPNGPSLALNPNAVYYVRVIRSPFSDSTTVSFSVPRCPTPTPTPTPGPTGTPKPGASPTPLSGAGSSPTVPPNQTVQPGQYYGPDETLEPNDYSDWLNQEPAYNQTGFRKWITPRRLAGFLIILGLILFGFWLSRKDGKSNQSYLPPKPPPPPSLPPPAPPQT